MTRSKWVQLGSVRRFDHVAPDKAHALKVLEEASEVHGAWQNLTSCYETYVSCCVTGQKEQADELLIPTIDSFEEKLLYECADVIQATIDLVAALGIEDFRPYMKACEQRNRDRGRITDGKVVDE